MASSIYGKLAVTNLKNNRKTYVPYILTAVLTVLMYYIMSALSMNTSALEFHSSLGSILPLGVRIILIFAVIFLFYTNSFLIKQRKKEIGIYNILGMGKRHIARMLLIETLITAGISIGAGVFCGVVFSKLMYLVFLKIIHYDVGMEFEVSVTSVIHTMIVFGIIFLLTLIYNLLQIKLANPIELLHGGNVGEKEPKTKWVMTIFGLVMIGIGYYIALTTDNPLQVITTFFIAVVFVILGTYALFLAGSIAFLKMLRKKKSFYYQTKHFTSVSGMIYRMKQNAVGLANICILSTMVLVMISTTVSLYVGMEDVLKTRFPAEYSITNYMTEEEEEKQIDEIVDEETKKAGIKRVNELRYHKGSMAAVKQKNGFETHLKGAYRRDTDSAAELYLIPLEDYNQLEHKQAALAENEVLIYSPTGTYGADTAKIGEADYRVKEELEKFCVEPKNKNRIIDAYYVILPTKEQIYELLNIVMEDSEIRIEDKVTVETLGSMTYEVSFDLEGDEEAGMEAMNHISKRVQEIDDSLNCESREESRESFYVLYGGLFFMGLYLGFLFLMATVLIIYYKQISEGYDDKERYQIMQKVGMSKREVKASIRSQVLTVFFLPLVVAILHIAVAFKVITKLMAVLNLVNVPLFLGCTILTVVVFAVFYTIVYGITAREYYKIVN